MIEEMLKGSVIRSYLQLLSDTNRAVFLRVLTETVDADGSRLTQCNEYIQHGSTSVLFHVIAVAIMALYLAQRFRIRVKKEELIRGALLHDYFLYDWHKKDPAHSVHGFTHPRKALLQAEMDFDLTPRERNMILRHMFPLTPIPPANREGMLLCLADKIVAAQETIYRK